MCGRNPKIHRKSNKGGFSLVEVLVAAFVGGLLVLVVTSFMTFSLNTQATTVGKLLVTKDIRTFTQEFARQARGAGYWELYDSIGSQNLLREEGDTGDLVLFYYENYSLDHEKFIIYKVTGFYRDEGEDGKGPVVRFDEYGEWESVDDYVIPSATGGKISSNNAGATIDQSTVVELAKGLANGHLFYNFASNNGLIIRGEIQQDGRLGQDAVNTYNFTVFPRG